eukprot:scaffold3362_cov402-Prasinococcus_capsulatus_cf.AAC.9
MRSARLDETSDARRRQHRTDRHSLRPPASSRLAFLEALGGKRRFPHRVSGRYQSRHKLISTASLDHLDTRPWPSSISVRLEDVSRVVAVQPPPHVQACKPPLSYLPVQRRAQLKRHSSFLTVGVDVRPGTPTCLHGQEGLGPLEDLRIQFLVCYPDAIVITSNAAS